jgi:glucose 1-dehydrogenase/3-oxoacyl-[acyl-carrier protein] reductase
MRYGRRIEKRILRVLLLLGSARIAGVDLSGTVAVVTGAGGGLGGGIARSFAAAGAAVVVHYRRSAEHAASVVGDIIAGGGRALCAQCDVTDPDGCAGLMAAAVDAFGRLDTVVANAGVQPLAELATMSVSQWCEVIDTNLTGSFATVQAAASVMRERGGGAIVLIGSTEGLQPAWSHAHYCASKAGLIHFARAAALEYGRYGIRVNSVSPGLVWRDGLDRDWPAGVARFRRAAPLRRLGRPADVGHACVFLASSKAEWITGQDLVVDGGVSARPTW